MTKKKSSSYSEKGSEFFWRAPIGDRQKTYVELMDSKQIVFAHGPAGCGKTMLALQQGLKLLAQHRITKIIYIRIDPVDKLGGLDLGALPGDVDEKMGPLLGPIQDNLDELCSPGKAKYIIDNGQIEAIPIRFLQGRSLANSFIIADESQNISPIAMELILTRLSHGSQMVLIGSNRQKISRDKFNNGLADAISVLGHLPNIGHVELTNADVQREGIVADINEAYAKRSDPWQHTRHLGIVS